ncbi:MAG: hypothetical protein HGA27_03725 [Peptococcaceae bacterium]|nr:hypothetical protein [Peptococcaceae bacterium]
MDKKRYVLPDLPKIFLSQQQKLVYDLSNNHSVKEISELTLISEKQVRQIFSVIRQKGKKYANKYVPEFSGAEHGNLSLDQRTNLNQDNDYTRFSEAEANVLQYLVKGYSVNEISKISKKSEQAIRKTKQRLAKKIPISLMTCNKSITKIDICKTRVKIDAENFLHFISRSGLDFWTISNITGIRQSDLENIVKNGFTSYHNLFLLMALLSFNPYGLTEKDKLSEKIKDLNWVSAVRESETLQGISQNKMKLKSIKDKSIYRNRVMYYGLAYSRNNNFSQGKNIIEYGRNGFLPLMLTKQQQIKCGWLIRKFGIKPVYRYKCPGLINEINQLELKIGNEEDPDRIDKYKKTMVLLKENMISEEGKAIYIINKNYLSEFKALLANK